VEEREAGAGREGEGHAGGREHRDLRHAVCGEVNRQVLRWKNDKPVLAEKVRDTLAGANTEIFDTLAEGR
jgi:hypothetical protein